MSPEIITGINGIFASIGLIVGIVIPRLFNFKQKALELTHDEAAEIKQELRVRCNYLQIENDELKNKYYTDMTKIKEEMYIIRSRLNAVETQLSDIKSRGWIPKEEEIRYQ